MQIIAALFGLIFPRGLIIILWLFTDWFQGIFDTFIWPLLGFFFAPYTLLWYTVVINWFGGIWDAPQIIVMVIAVFIDLVSWIPSLRERAS